MNEKVVKLFHILTTSKTINNRLFIRIRNKVIVNSLFSCWLWQGSKNKGYGQLNIDGKTVKIHRLLFKFANGYEAITINHICTIRNCVNPLHLESVTIKENNQFNLLQTRQTDKSFETHCQRGHLYTITNTYKKYCKECKKLYRKYVKKTVDGLCRNKKHKVAEKDFYTINRNGKIVKTCKFCAKDRQLKHRNKK